MKQIAKKLFTFVLALTVACTVIPPMTAEAVSAPKTAIMYKSNKNSGNYYASFYVGDLTKKQTIKKSTVESSNTSVATPYYLEKYKSTYGWSTDYFDGYDPYEYSNENYGYYIGLKFKKTGTTNVSYKVDSKKYTTKATLKNYTNPIKTANIAGIKSGSSTNLASKLSKQNYANLKLTKKVSSAKVKFAANSGWRINYVEVYDSSTGNEFEVSNYGEKGVGTTTLNVGTLKANKKVTVRVGLVNTKDGGSQYCYYYIN